MNSIQNIESEKFNQISKNELKEFLIQNWITHDAMWFYNGFQEIPLNKVMTINLKASKALGKIEIVRIKKLLGVKKITNFHQLEEFLLDAFKFLMPNFMGFTFSFSTKNVLKWKWHSCFAYNGTKKNGVINDYKCAVIPRIESWFDGLKIKYESKPVINGCLMHQNGSCQGEFHIIEYNKNLK